MQLGVIPQKLRSLRRRLRFLVGLVGLSQLLVCIGGFVVGSFALDWALGLPWGGRLVVLVGAVLALGCAAMWALISPWKRLRSLTDDEAALLVERRFELDDALVSAVQLARSRGGVDRGGAHAVWSEALVDKLLEDADRSARTMDFTQAADQAPGYRWASAAAACIVFVLGCASLIPVEAATWWERQVLLREVPWPRAIDMTVSLRPEGGLVAAGSDVVVVGRVVRGEPGSASVQLRFHKSGIVEHHPMASRGQTWHAVVENVTESFDLQVSAGDFVSSPFPITVRQPPALASLAVWLDYPDYAGLADTPPEKPLADGNITVPQGTRLSYEALATEALGAVGCELSPSPGDGGAEADLGADDRLTFRGSFVARRSAVWSFVLTSERGFSSKPLGRYRLKVLEDKLPLVSIGEPGRNLVVTDKAKVALVAMAEDDYGCVAATLKVHVEATATTYEVALAELEQPAVKLELAHVIAVADYATGSGQTLTYWIEARDGRALAADSAGVVWGRSPKYRLQVVSPADLERLLEGRLRRSRDDLDRLSRIQQRTERSVKALDEASEKGELSADQRRQLVQSVLDQRQVSRGLDAVAADLERVAEAMSSNEVGGVADQSWLAGVVEEAKDVSQGPVAKALAELMSQRSSAKPSLSPASSAAAEAATRIGKLVRKLDKWDQFNDVIRDVRALLELQKRTLEGTRSRARTDLNR